MRQLIEISEIKIIHTDGEKCLTCGHRSIFSSNDVPASICCLFNRCLSPSDPHEQSFRCKECMEAKVIEAK